MFNTTLSISRAVLAREGKTYTLCYALNTAKLRVTPLFLSDRGSSQAPRTVVLALLRTCILFRSHADSDRGNKGIIRTHMPKGNLPARWRELRAQATEILSHAAGPSLSFVS